MKTTSFSYKDAEGASKDLPITLDMGGSDDIQISTWKLVEKSQKFTGWVNRVVTGGMNLNSVKIQSVDKFGEKIGFIKLEADATDGGGHKVPGVVFIRGDSVAVLIILTTPRGDDYCLLTAQPRLPAGHQTFLELPAGMMDEEENVSLAAAKEIAEETGLTVKSNELIDITKLAYPESGDGILMSPGGCDERIKLMLHRQNITDVQLTDMLNKEHGNKDEKEKIVLNVVPTRTAWKATNDAKTICAIALYRHVYRSLPPMALVKKPGAAVTKVVDLEPETSGLNLLVKVTKEPVVENMANGGPPFFFAQVGDGSGCVAIKIREQHADLLRPVGKSIMIRNSRVTLYQNKIRLDINQWSKISDAEREADEDWKFEANCSNDVSAVEYELVEVSVNSPKNKRNSHSNNGCQEEGTPPKELVGRGRGRGRPFRGGRRW